MNGSAKMPLQEKKNSRIKESGYSLAEVLVIVVILGVLASASSVGLDFILRWSRVTAVAVEVAGWIERVRAASASQISSDVSSGGCLIVFSPGNSNATPGYQIASADCGVPPLIIPAEASSAFKIKTSVPPEYLSTGSSSAIGSVNLVFSPRGMWSIVAPTSSSGAVAVLEDDIEIRIALADGRGRKRCVRISSILGSVDIGSGNDSSLDSACSFGESL